MAEETRRPTAVSLTRVGTTRFEATNERGGTLPIGPGDSPEFTPVELLMAAIAGCGAIDVDLLTTRYAEPESSEASVTADRVKNADGNIVENIDVTFRLRFPEGEGGDRARSMLDRAITRAHDRMCTVSRTVEAGTPVSMHSD
ncbi:OsmC family protein [Tessaracoccus caeni]|uniref:OsmC family protein n=1 Tax=Tessaracoccus caeni TaxID=3031239 RepID=UPI0023DA696A|nr:OsmC family protein [Tessaracoccus caeni]MDF1487377.1 OsmC family protein [Tessaracoccus caeni]